MQSTSGWPVATWLSVHSYASTCLAGFIEQETVLAGFNLAAAAADVKDIAPGKLALLVLLLMRCEIAGGSCTACGNCIGRSLEGASQVSQQPLH